MVQELLVVLVVGPPAVLREAAQRLGALHPIVSTLGARLLVLRAGIAAQAGVQAVAANAQDVAGLAGLDENAQLFASAWAA